MSAYPVMIYKEPSGVEVEYNLATMYYTFAVPYKQWERSDLDLTELREALEHLPAKYPRPSEYLFQLYMIVKSLEDKTEYKP